jgi:hypothetical protein
MGEIKVGGVGAVSFCCIVFDQFLQPSKFWQYQNSIEKGMPMRSLLLVPAMAALIASLAPAALSQFSEAWHPACGTDCRV